MLISLISCKEKPSSDLSVINKYLVFPVSPKKISYVINKKDLPRGSQDCSKIISINCEVEFYEKDFVIIKNKINNNIKYEIPIEISTEAYKDWYSDDIKKTIIRMNDDFVKLIPPIYNGNFLTNNKHYGDVLIVLSKKNKLLILAKYCE